MDGKNSNRNKNLFLKLLIILLNAAGIICLLWLAIPFIMHDTTAGDPDAMLPIETWEACGISLTIGLLPLLAANTAAFVFLNKKKDVLRYLYFFPGAVCLVLVVVFWSTSLSDPNYEDIYSPKQVSSFAFELDGEVYNYSVYQEEDGTYSVGMDEKDKMPLSVIDYGSPEKIYESIGTYYEEMGGTSR